MTSYVRRAAMGLGLALALFLAAGDLVSGQIIYNKGQSIQPVFEGWEKNTDGSYNLVFGYLNRNYLEEPIVPVGPDNAFEPGQADRGQPTYFYTRRQSFIFKVRVPGDFGNQELIWNVTSNGRKQQAVGNLLPKWALDPGVYKANRGSGISGREGMVYVPDQPPTIELLGSSNANIAPGQSLTIEVMAKDPDGKPGPRPASRRGGDAAGGSGEPPLPNDLPTFGGKRANGGAASGTGGPTDQNIVSVRTAWETGLGVTFLHYRGPGKVTFNPQSAPVKADGKATTTVVFSEPGDYVIRAVADDSILMTSVNIPVTVKGAAGSVQ